MFTDEDIAFQRAILAAPGDTTLKLVYADWLQDRADPRAEFVRLQVQLSGMIDSTSGAQAAGVFSTLGAGLAPAWVAFMTTLAQPFVPLWFQEEEPALFTQPLGHRGRVVTCESQYRDPSEWNEQLLTDLVFLTTTDWGECHFGAGAPALDCFLCELPAEGDTLTDEDVFLALHVPPSRRDWITELFDDQFLFDNEGEGSVTAGPHGKLKEYVAGRLLLYASLGLREQHNAPEWHGFRVGLAVGRSPLGNRLVGVQTCQSFATG